MKRGKNRPPAIHTWLIMLKASQAIEHYLLPRALKAGLGDSDFRVLDVLLHKDAMPVNAIGPKVNLNPGSVSVAVDRLYKKGLVSRIECEADRRVRTVSLTDSGRELFLPLSRQQAALLQRAFQDVSPDEQQQVEDVLKRIGKRAEALPAKRVYYLARGIDNMRLSGAFGWKRARLTGSATLGWSAPTDN